MRPKKVSLAHFFSRFGITKLYEKFSLNGIVVLNYHRLKAERSNDHRTKFCKSVFGPNVDLFEKQMKWLSHNFDVISENDLLDILNEKISFPMKSALVTFDDGYIDNYTLAYPVLKLLGIPAIFFIPTLLINTRRLGWWDIIEFFVRKSNNNFIHFSGQTIPIRNNLEKTTAVKIIIKYICKTNNCEPAQILDELSLETGILPPNPEIQDRELMTWEQIKDLSNNGMFIGSHTHSHKVLSTLGVDEQKVEMTRSKQILEKGLNISVKSIAYPIGGNDTFTDETKAIAKNVGFELGFSFVAGSHRRRIEDPYELKRISPHSSFEFFKMSVLQPNIFVYK